MFEFTGKAKDGSIADGKIIPAEELIELFNLPITPGQSVRFELTASAKKGDRYAIKRLINTTIQGYYRGTGYMIRYYETKVFKPPSNNAAGFNVYSPARVEFKGKLTVVDTSESLEKAVLLCLSKTCENSPFNTNKSVSDFKIVDTEQIAKTRFAEETSKSIAREFFMKTTDELKVRRIAKGIVLPGGKNVDRSRIGSDIETRMYLIELMNEFPSIVGDAINSTSVLSRGMVHDAVDNGLLYTKPTSGGVSIWKWTSDDTEVCRVGGGKPDLEGLVEYIMQADNFRDFSKRLGAEAVLKNQDSLASALNDSGLDSLVKEGIDYDDKAYVLTEMLKLEKIWLDLMNLKVYLMDEEGEKQKMPLGSVDSANGWLAQLQENITAQSYGRVKKAFQNIKK